MDYEELKTRTSRGNEMVHKSFTNTWIAFYHGLLVVPEDKFRFHCTRFHLHFDDAVNVPVEVGWVEEIKVFNHEYILAESVLPEVLEKFREFQKIILFAERFGNVAYRGKVNGVSIEPFTGEWMNEEREEL